MPAADELFLRPLRLHDEAAALMAHRELALEGVTFLLDTRDGEPWKDYLNRVEGWRHLPPNSSEWVASTFLVAEVTDTIVGRVSIRHELTPYVAEIGGHIGYAVRPAFRSRGYATSILAFSLTVARQIPLESVCSLATSTTSSPHESSSGAVACSSDSPIRVVINQPSGVTGSHFDVRSCPR